MGFIVALIMIGATLSFLGAKEALLAHLSDSVSALSLEKALNLDPQNARAHFRLGSVYMLSMEEQDLPKALKHLRRATELNPHNGRYWLRLAAAWESTGDAPKGQAAMERALRLRPKSPEFWWAAGNYYLRNGDLESAWTRFRYLLELSPDHAEAVFQLCHLAAGEPSVVFAKVLTPEASPAQKLAYVDFLSRQGEHEIAYHIWQQTAAEAIPRSFDFATARPYLEQLLAQNSVEEATSVWNDLARLEIVSRPPSSEIRNVVFNGGFERPPLNAGFDWRSRRFPYVAIEPQAPDRFQGVNGLRVDFTVKHNDEYELIYQIVPVLPRRQYRLEAYVRSQGITSDSGPRLRVVELASPPRLVVSTPPVIGTTDWHPIALTFTTGPETRLIRLAVWRPRSRTYPTEISGSFWMDSVSLNAVQPADRQVAAHPLLLP